jgi:hypothetical protein
VSDWQVFRFDPDEFSAGITEDQFRSLYIGTWPDYDYRDDPRYKTHYYHPEFGFAPVTPNETPASHA